MRIRGRSLAAMVACALFTPLLASAGTRGCTSAMVSLGICRTTADVAYCLAIGTTDPDAGGPLLAPSATIADAFANLYGWQSTAPCTADMVAGGICTAGQLGAVVSVSKAQFADMQVRLFVRDTIRRYLRQQALAAAATSSDAQPDPDLGN